MIGKVFILFGLFTLGSGSEVPPELLKFDSNKDGILDVNLLVTRNQVVENDLIDTLASENLQEYFTITTLTDLDKLWPDMALVSLKVGTHLHDFDVLYEGIPWPALDSEQEYEQAKLFREEEVAEQLDEFIRNIRSVDIGWVNFEDSPIEMFWKSHRNELIPVGTLNPGEGNTEWRETYIGHEFILRWEQGTEKIYKVFGDQFHTIGAFPSQVGSVTPPSKDHFDRLSKYERARAEKVKRTFTNVGYKRTAAPRELFADIRRYWNMNRNQSFIEDWRGRGFYVNWWEVDARMIPPSFRLKQKWHDLLLPYLEEWSGVALEPTDLYGIRTYYRGAWLFNHVDREETHAVSAIINVEQAPTMDQDWKLEFVDVNWQLKHAEMKPGDAMYYESARCLHGRPVPLQGDYYANVFFHYRPLGEGRLWFADMQDKEKIRENLERRNSDLDEDDYDEDEDEDDGDDDEFDTQVQEREEL